MKVAAITDPKYLYIDNNAVKNLIVVFKSKGVEENVKMEKLMARFKTVLTIKYRMNPTYILVKKKDPANCYFMVSFAYTSLNMKADSVVQRSDCPFPAVLS